MLYLINMSKVLLNLVLLHKPKKVQSPLTNKIVYDLETSFEIRTVRFACGVYKLSKVSSKYYRINIITRISKMFK